MATTALPHICTLSTLFPNATQPNFGIFVERQCKSLAARGEFRLTVINPIGVPPWPLNRHPRYKALCSLPDRETWNGLDVWRPRFPVIPGIGGRWNPALLTSSLLSLMSDLHQSAPIALIDAEFFYPDGPAAMQLAQKLDIPFSVKARGADIHFWGKAPGCEKQLLAAGKAAKGLLAVSEALKADMGSLGMDQNKITVHYTGVDKSRFRPVNRQEAKTAVGISGPAIITVGALIPRKGQDLVIRALTEIPDAILLVAGQGAEESSYRRLANDLKLGDRVRFLGSVPHDDLPLYICAAEVAVLPSESEGLANAWVEALACGTPLVISDAGGAAELLKNPVAGAIVPRDPHAIASAITALLMDQPPPIKVAETVRNFGWERNAEKLSRHFERLIGIDKRPA